MPIDFHCKGCGKHYRVRDELAGRAAECKQCGTKMVVPQLDSPPDAVDDDAAGPIGFQDNEPPPRVASRQPARSAPPPREPEYDSESGYESESSYDSESQSDEMDVSPEPDRGPTSLRDFDVKDDAPEQHEARRERLTPLLPDVVGEMALPLVAILIGLGAAGFVAFKAAVASTNPLIAFVLMAVGIGLFFLVIVPLTLKGLEAAATNIGFELANALKLQTIGLVAIPTGAAVLGYFNAGTSGAINWGIFGLLVMCVAIVLIYRAGIVKSLLAALWTAVTYALTAGLSIGIAALLAFGMTKAGVRMPWVEKPAPPVAKVDPDAERKEEERKREEERIAAATNTPKPEEAPKIDPTPPPKPAVTWAPIVDPSPTTSVRWPTDLKNQLIDVKPPVTLARSSPGSPFVAFVDGVALHVYDVRTAKRTGFIKDKPPVIGSLLSPDGSILIVNRRAEGSPQVSGGTPEFEVWTIPDGRRSRTLSLDTRRQIPQLLGFDKDNRLITVTEWEGKGFVQAWDTRSATAVRELSGPNQLSKPQTSALSAGGRFIACVADSRLNVFDLNSGTLVCDREMPRRDAQTRAMSFSPDGSQLAAVVGENNKNFLLVFNNETGDVALDAELGGGNRPDLSAEQMFWVPRGGALLVGNDWVDTATGRIVAILSPQTAGQSVGKAKLMFSDSQALVEFLPAGNAQRVIYKGVSLNKKEIDAALADRRAKSGDASPGEAAADAPVVVPTNLAPKELIAQAVDHLSNDRQREALAFAQAAIDKLPKSTKAETDEHAIALHVLGAAYMRAGDMTKARDPIDKAAAYSKTSRALVLNRAKLDIASQNFVVRAIRDLDKQLATTLDEETLNLAGLAISKLQPGQATPVQLKVFNDKYDAYNKKLETAKPGMKHWGNQWISESEFATSANPPELVDERAKGEERVKLAAAEVERTRKGFADAKKQSFYDANKKDIPRDPARKNQPMYLSKAEDDFAAAQKESDAAKVDLDAINSRFPKPPFEENLEPTVPELELVAKTP